MREGYAFVGLSAQQQGVDGSPLAPRWWDVQRYGDLNHPGDDYSYDILSQTAYALQERPRPDPDPLAGHNARAILVTGASQSAGYLHTYINEVQELHGMVDGFLPFVSSPGSNRGDLRDDLVPILWVNSEDETSSEQRPDAGQFKLWEMAGASHVSEWWDIYTDEMRNRDQAALSGEGYEPEWDEWEAGQYGERGSNLCPGNMYPSHYVLRAATDALNEWVTNNREAPSAPRIERTDTGQVAEDEHFNALGGVRLPVIDVPVATYEARTCSLWGQTIQFDPVTLDEMYDSNEDYVTQLSTAADKAIENGWLLSADADDLLERARTSSIGD